jgi:hypothetical protein
MGAEQQVVEHRHGPEELPALGNQCQTPAGDRLGRLPGDVLAAEGHPPGPGGEQPDHRRKEGALPCAVGAEDRDELALPGHKRDAPQHRDRAVAGGDVLGQQERLGHV